MKAIVLGKKSWLLYKVGSIQYLMLEDDNNIITLLNKEIKKTFNNSKELEKFLGSKLTFEDLEENIEQQEAVSSIDDYPVKHYNAVKDSNVEDIVIYKKDGKDILYVAGYWGIKTAGGWRKTFCPKLSTIDTCVFAIGPFKTILELNTKLKTEQHDE